MVTNIQKVRTTSILSVEGTAFLQNVGNHLQDYTTSQPRRPQCTSLSAAGLNIPPNSTSGGKMQPESPPEDTVLGPDFLNVPVSRLIFVRYLTSTDILQHRQYQIPIKHLTHSSRSHRLFP